MVPEFTVEMTGFVRPESHPEPSVRPRGSVLPAPKSKNTATKWKKLLISSVQSWLTKEGEQVMPMIPQVLRQRLVGRISLGREYQVGQLVLQAATSHGQTVAADFASSVTVTQIQSSSEQLSHPTWETDGSPRRRRRHLVGTP